MRKAQEGLAAGQWRFCQYPCALGIQITGQSGQWFVWKHQIPY